MPVAAWAHAELGLGVALANLSALRPLLEKMLDLGATLRSSKKRTADQAPGDQYMELEEGISSKKTASLSKGLNGTTGMNTKTGLGEDLDGNSSLGDDDRSTRNIMSKDGMHIAHR
jgi:hypothetical protein